MSEKEFWWASVEGGEPQVVEVNEWPSGCRWVFVTGNDCEIDIVKVQLIERIRPPAPVGDASPWQKIAGDDVDPIPWTQKVELGDCHFRAERTPYLLDLMKSLGDDPVERVVFRMPSQVGHSFTLAGDGAENVLGVPTRQSDPDRDAKGWVTDLSEG